MTDLTDVVADVPPEFEPVHRAVHRINMLQANLVIQPHWDTHKGPDPTDRPRLESMLAEAIVSLDEACDAWLARD